MAFRTSNTCPSWSPFADVENEESEQSDIDGQSNPDEEEEDDDEESQTTSSYNNSPIASFCESTTTGISSMDTSGNIRAANSTCTLDDLFREDQMNEIDEGFVAIDKPLDVDVNFVIDLNNQQTSSTPQISDLSTPTIAETTSKSYTPLKHHLKPVCTIGTGTFGRVQLCKHRETGDYYALKSMYIPSILERRQLNHVFNEKRILSKLEHPFIVKLYDTAKDSKNLYMIMEYLSGGELFSYLRMTRTFPSNITKFYAAEILLALEYLHGLNIAYRDLKPENLMLSRDGHIKITDFSFAKQIDSKSFSLCGTCEYLAPELASRKGHTVAVDFWSLGILIFELIAGYTPFHGSSVDEVQASIRNNPKPDFPHKTFSANNKSLITQLLSIDAKERGTASDIKKHSWFSEIRFDDMLAKKVKPPIIPTVYTDGDTGNFDSYEEIDSQPPAKQRDLNLFDEW